MVSPKSHDWWLAAALAGAALPNAVAQPANPGLPMAVVTDTSNATGGKAEAKPVYVDSATSRKFTTGPDGRMHILFSDQSAMTLGPNSELIIEKYQFDSNTKNGSIVANMTKGFLRVVGGLISKKSDTTVKVASATIGIRGGIAMIDANANSVSSTFLFGQSMTVTDPSGNSQTITRPGFSTSFNGSSWSPPTFNQVLSPPPPPPSGPPAPSPSPMFSGIGGGSGNPADTLSGDRLQIPGGTNRDIVLTQLLGSNNPNNNVS
jgi:FecR protein